MEMVLSIFCLLLMVSCTSEERSTCLKKDLQPVEQLLERGQDSLHHLNISFVGDIMGHDAQIRAAAGAPSEMKSQNMADFNYETCFRYIKPILEKADLAVGNLELTLNGKGRYTGYPMFRSPDALASYLKEAGFDLLSTCNNHSNDGLKYGIEHTIDVLDSVGILHTGTFKNQAERDSLYPLIVEKEADGAIFRLAFLSYTFSTNGVRTRPPSVVNKLEQNQIYKDIVKAKEANPDLIIALMHWGKEYKLDEDKRQSAYAQFLWENGVDVVIGGHPHVVQPIKTARIWKEDQKLGKEVVVAYSLGNFISNQYRANTDIGLVFELELVKNSRQNRTFIGDHNYVLVWRYIQGRYDSKRQAGFDWNYAVLPVAAFETAPKSYLQMQDRQLKAMQSAAKRMRAHLGKWQSKERKMTLKDLGDLPPLLPKQPYKK